MLTAGQRLLRHPPFPPTVAAASRHARMSMPVVITEVPTPGGTTEVPTAGHTIEKSTRKDQGQAQRIIAAEVRATITVTGTRARLTGESYPRDWKRLVH
jgi:hypothetical protein